MRIRVKRMSKAARRLATIAERVVAELMAGVDGASAATIATADGLDLAHAGSHAIDPSRLGAIVSSLAALSDAAGREAGLGRTRCLVVECGNGRLVVRCIEVRGESIVVAILTNQHVLLGRVWTTMSGVESIMNAG